MAQSCLLTPTLSTLSSGLVPDLGYHRWLFSWQHQHGGWSRPSMSQSLLPWSAKLMSSWTVCGASYPHSPWNEILLISNSSALLHILLLFRSARYNQALQELRRLKPFILVGGVLMNWSWLIYVLISRAQENFVSSLVLLPKTAFAICHIIGFLADLRQVGGSSVCLLVTVFALHTPFKNLLLILVGWPSCWASWCVLLRT
mgnify:CR=1 FL=1